MAEGKEHTELLPCPFCGGQLFRREYLVIEGVIGCRTCGATITRKHQPECDDGLVNAEIAWNTRSAVNTYPAVEGLVKALEDLKPHFHYDSGGDLSWSEWYDLSKKIDSALSRFRSHQNGGAE